MKPIDSGVQALSDAEIARRALKLLAERKLVPTPETFADAFWESAGLEARNSEASSVLKDLWADLVRQSRLSGQESGQLLQAAQRRQWAQVRDGTERALARRPGAQADAWPATLVDVLKQSDAQHSNWTRARKLEAIARVVDAAAGDPAVVLERLRRLLESWDKPLIQTPRVDDEVGTVADAPAAETATASIAPGERAGSTSAGPQLPLTAPVRARGLDRDLAEEQIVRKGLQRLLAVLCDNLSRLAPDEPWLLGQLEPLRALLGEHVGAGQIVAAERRLSELAAQQMLARRGLQEAKVALTEMLATLLERVGTMSTSAERFNDQVGAYQVQLKELNQSPDLVTLSRIVHGLLADTQTVRDQIEVSRSELTDARKKVQLYEARVSQLEQQLNEVSTLVQKDPLTNALNRRGVEQAFRTESARAQRYGSALTLAMLDLDNFKQINDRLGHAAGDRALVHFVTTVHAILRPTDLTGRAGGEEFSILFPALTAQEGLVAVERLQRELARRPFVFEGERLDLTFSAGIAQWQADESLDQMMRRADAALYEAKNAGKNRARLA